MSKLRSNIERCGSEESLRASSGKRRLIGDRGSHFLKRMKGETGANIAACYQCERCTNACPVFYFTELLRLAFAGENGSAGWFRMHIADPVPLLRAKDLLR